MIGPPIMIENAIPVLERMGAQMSGVGKCGRFNAGPVYVCKEGPVFTFQELQAMPLDY